MKVNKILALILSIAMIFSLLTACDSSTPSQPTEEITQGTPEATESEAPEETPDSQNTQPESNDGEEATEYEVFMDAYISDFNAVMETLETTLAEREIENEDDLINWLRELESIKDEVTRLSNNLATIANDVPEEYVEAHTVIVEATTVALGAMVEFENVVIAAIGAEVLAIIIAFDEIDEATITLIMESEEAIIAGIIGAKIRIEVSRTLWTQAVEYYN